MRESTICSKKRAHFIATQDAPLGACVRELLATPAAPKGSGREGQRRTHAPSGAKSVGDKDRTGRRAFDEGGLSLEETNRQNKA